SRGDGLWPLRAAVPGAGGGEGDCDGDRGLGMTEAEWIASKEPHLMTRFITLHQGNNRRKAGRRKLRLFGCACCHQLDGRMSDPRSQHAVAVAERLADGNAGSAEVEEALTLVELAYYDCCHRISIDPSEHLKAEKGRGWLGDDERRAAQAAWTVLRPRVGDF